jgi:hypothetical protein
MWCFIGFDHDILKSVSQCSASFLGGFSQEIIVKYCQSAPRPKKTGPPWCCQCFSGIRWRRARQIHLMATLRRAGIGSLVLEWMSTGQQLCAMIVGLGCSVVDVSTSNVSLFGSSSISISRFIHPWKHPWDHQATTGGPSPAQAEPCHHVPWGLRELWCN